MILKIIVFIVIISFFKEPITNILNPFIENFEGIYSIVSLFNPNNFSVNWPIILILLVISAGIIFKIYSLRKKIYTYFVHNDNTLKENIILIVKREKIMIIFMIGLLIFRIFLFQYII